MLRRLAILVLPLAWGHSLVQSQQAILPEPVPADLVPTPPFSYNGFVRITSPQAYGSGSMIGEGVMATAAHVIYDESIFQPIPASRVEYYPQSDSNEVWFGRTRYKPVALYYWSDYSSRVRDDSSDEGFSTPNTFNLDFAVGWFSEATVDDLITEHAEVHVDPLGTVTVHRHPREKMIVGYPQENVDDLGLMHVTAPGDYYTVEAMNNQDMPGFDFGGQWASVYYFYDVATYSGGSGGPIYIRDDMGNWMMAGLAVGGTGNTVSLIRSVDENAWAGIGQEGMIQEAIRARNGDAMRRVDDLHTTTVSMNAISLGWTDLSTMESGYTVFRQETGEFEEIATIPVNSTSYVDETVQPGKVYHYQVQPFRTLTSTAHINKSPKSPPLAVHVPGADAEAGNYLNTGFLKLTSNGASSWYVDTSNRLRAGIVRPMGSSSLFLDIMGPGTLTFDWSASCEVNEHYTNNNPQDPDSQYFGLVYDAIWLYLNGNKVETDNEPVFLSGPLPDDATGILSESGIVLELPEGPQRVEWRYEKDPYTDDHQDTAFLDAISWSPATTDPYPVYAGYQIGDSEWHGSEWFGAYDARHWPWVEHQQLGWLYMIDGTGDAGVYFHSNHPDLGFMFTSPAYWPFLYRPQSETWIYYYQDSGSFGHGAEFFDFGEWQTIRMDDR